MRLSAGAETADQLIGWLRDFGSRRVDLVLQDERRCLAPHVVVELGRMGVLGLSIPRSYGGLEFSVTDQLRVIETIGAIDLSIASFVGLSASLGVRPILGFARQEVKDELLPLIASGRLLSAFALTEPGAGSNPDAMQASATRRPDGSWVLSGEKMWIGNGEWAGVYTVFARDCTDSAEGGATGFLVRADNPGLRVGPEHLTMGIRPTVQNRLFFDEAVVPAGDLLGEPGAGKAAMQATMMPVRLEIAAGAVGAMQRCVALMHRYASRRTVSTGLLLDNGMTRLRINEAIAKMSAVRALVFLIAREEDAGRAVPPEMYGLVKAAGSEVLWEIADSAVQLLGGRGYTENNQVARILRDSRILRIFEGPTETLQHFAGAVVRMRGFRRFIADALEQPQLAERFNRDLKELKEILADRDRDLGLIRVGQLAMWLSLHVAATIENDHAPSPLGQLAVALTSREYDAAHARCHQDDPPQQLSLEQLAEAVDRHCKSAGLDPVTVGVEDELDPLLVEQ